MRHHQLMLRCYCNTLQTLLWLRRSLEHHCFFFCFDCHLNPQLFAELNCTIEDTLLSAVGRNGVLETNARIAGDWRIAKSNVIALLGEIVRPQDLALRGANAAWVMFEEQGNHAQDNVIVI